MTMPEPDTRRRMRSVFYERVGLSDRANLPNSDVSEKDRLQELLSLKPLPVARLGEFCSLHKVPDQYRQLVWKLILNIVPQHAENCQFVREKRELVFWNAWRCLLALRLESIEWNLIDSNNNVSALHRVTGNMVLACMSSGVGIQRNSFIIDYLASNSETIQFACVPNYSSLQWLADKIKILHNSGKDSTPMTDDSRSQFTDSNSDEVFSSPSPDSTNNYNHSKLDLTATPTEIQRRNSCSAVVGHNSWSRKKDSVSSVSKKMNARLSSGTVIGIMSPSSDWTSNISRTTSEDVLLDKTDDLRLDANVYGVYTLKKHFIGFTPSATYNDPGWDFDAVEVPTEKAVPSLVDCLIMWAMSQNLMCSQTYTWRIINSPEMSAYLCLGRHLYCDSIEETYGLRCSVWDLINKNQKSIIEAVVIEGRRILVGRNLAVSQLLESINFFSSSRLPYMALSLFSNILSPVAAEKVLDKVIAKSFNFLSYLIVELLLQMRQTLSGVSCPRQALFHLTQMKPADTECAVSTALELFHRDNQ